METQTSTQCQSLVNLENGDLNAIKGEKPEYTAQMILKEIAEDIRTLRKEKANLETLLESRTQEVERLKGSVTYFQREYERIQEALQSIQKCIVEKEDLNKIQKVQIANLEAELKQAESNLLTTRQICQEIQKKHNKLRDFSATIVTDLQNVIVSTFLSVCKPNQSIKGTAGGVAPHDRLAAMGVLFNDKFTQLESSRQGIQETATRNQQTILGTLEIIQKLSNSKSTKPNSKLANNKIRTRIICCNLCGKRIPTRRALLVHRRNLHAVQKARKFLQEKNSGKTTVVLEKTQGGCQWNIASTHDIHIQEAGNFYHELNQSRRINLCNNGEMPTFTPMSEPNSSNSKESASSTTTPENEYNKTPNSEVSAGPYLKEIEPRRNQEDQETSHLHNQPKSINLGNNGMPIFSSVLQPNSSISEESATRSTPNDECNIPNPEVSEDPPLDETQYPGGGCSCCGINVTNPPNLDPMSSANSNAAFLAETHISAPVNHGMSRCYSTQNGFYNFPVLPSHVEPIFSSLRTPTVFNIYGGHMFQASEGPNVLLCRCGTKFGNWDTLNAHVLYFSMRKGFFCYFCKETLHSFRAANEHVEKVHNTQVDPNYSGCETCGVIFANREEYSRHMIATGNGDTRFICSMKIFTQRSSNTVNASAITSNESSASQGIRSKSPIPVLAFKPVEPTPKSNFTCQICGERFLFACAFHLHMEMEHKLLLRNFGSSCKACGKNFANDADFYYHSCTLHAEFGEPSQNTQMLPTPSMPIMHSQNLAQHPSSGIDHVHNNPPWKHGRNHIPLPLNPHASEKEYPCTCGRVFKCEYSRNRHIRRKNIGRIFVCSWCPGRFDRYSVLQNHVKVYHPECVDQMAKYACITCAKPCSNLPEMYLHKASEH